LSCTEQARAQFSPLESGDTKAKQATAKPEKVREEVRCKHVEAQAKKVHPLSIRVYLFLQFFLSLCMLTDFPILQAPPLVPRSKNLVEGSLNLLHLIPRKHRRTKDGYDVAAAFAPHP